MMTKQEKELYKSQQDILKTLTESISSFLSNDPEDMNTLLGICENIKKAGEQLIEETRFRKYLNEYFKKLDTLKTKEENASPPQL